jgi:type II secretion system protein N
MAVNWSDWRPRLLYGAFFLAAFLVAMRQTLPVEAVKERLIVEAARQGWQLSVGDAGPAGVVGVGLRDVTLKDREGLVLPVESLDVTAPVWALLTGRRRATVTARLYDGHAQATFDLAAGSRSVDLVVDKVDLGQALPLRKAAGVDLEGVLSGTGQVVLPADEKGKPTGQVDLTVTGFGMASGKLPIPGMGAGLTLPKLGFGTLVGSLKLEGGKGTFEKLSATGGDADLVADGLSFTLQPKLEFAPLFGRATIKPSEAFLQRPEGRNFKPLLDAALGGGPGQAGWTLQVYGSLGHPQVRPGAAGAPSRP